MNLVKKVAKHFNNMAEHGSVPSELFNSDSDYWIMVANISMCEYDSQCDAKKLANAQDGVTPISTGIWKYVLPEAAATTYVNYYMNAYMDATGCYYNDCYRSYTTYPNGAGVIDVVNFQGSGGEIVHTAPGETLSFHASTCGYYPGQTVTNQVTVTPYLAMQLEPSVSDSDTSTGSCANASSSFPVTKDWIYGIKAESTGSYY